MTSSLPEVGDDDVEELKSAGLSDLEIHDAVQVISYFNYITRIASTLGVEPTDYPEQWGGV